MGKELVLLFVIIIAIFFVWNSQRDMAFTSIRPSHSVTRSRRVKFADTRHERIFNKDTGNIIEEKLSAV